MRQRVCGPLVLLATLISATACMSPPYQPARAPQGVAALVPPEVQHWSGTHPGGGGLQIFEQHWRPTGTSRAALVLVHGLKDHSSRYRDLGINLANRGLSLYAFDLRGHGYSEGTRDHIDSLDHALADLAGVIERARDRDRGKPIYLLGQGFGASLAAVYVARGTRPMDGLILIAPPLRGEVKRSERVGTRAAAIFGPTTHRLEIDLTKWSSDPSVVKALQNDPLIYDGQPTASTAGEVLRASDELTAKAPAIKTPVLVLFGGADAVSSLELGRALHEQLGASDKVFQTYEGLYHDVLHEPRRHEVIADLSNWVSDRAARAAVAAQKEQETAQKLPPAASGDLAPGQKRPVKKN
jgi:alpha-beta hydrolase superfamily lysophospholipase